MFLSSDGFQPPTVLVHHHCHHSQVARNKRYDCWDLFVIGRSRPTDDDRDADIILPTVWIQEAEHDFVDDDENLEAGEVCLKSTKAFASPSLPDSDIPRFLSAGALVQRRPVSNDNNFADTVVCDAWTADAILEEGGPNLQFQGACLILDDFIQFHLERHRDDPIGALRTIVVQCGDDDIESETSCASFLAAKSRGFRPLKELLRETSIYTKFTYIGSDGNLDGMVLDINNARDIYQRLANEVHCRNPNTLSRILQLLPQEDVVQRFTIKRFSAK